MTDQGYGGGQQQGPPACVQMRGLPYSAVEADITTFFQRAGVTPVHYLPTFSSCVLNMPVSFFPLIFSLTICPVLD
jgi:hypothetical protein